MTIDKLCVIYNFAQNYRTAIFRAIDNNWDCKWIFGRNTTDIKGMDTSLLKDVDFVENKKVIGPLFRQTGIAAEASKAEYDTILMLGEPFNVSTWNILLRNKFSRNRKRIFMWSHGWYGREGFFKKWLKRAFFGLADKTFLYGNYAKDVAVSQGFPPEKLAVIHNSLDHEEQVSLRKSLLPSGIYRRHFGNDNPVLIFIGRLTAVKRLDLLLTAIESLNRKNENYNIVLVGDGEKREELESIVRESGLEGQVWFYGACYDDNQNARLISEADLCVAPGNVGLTAIHTMVFGTPVLTHDNFPMQMPEFEAIHRGRTGDFFKYDNVESLADAISRWFASHRYEREEIRKYCYEEIDSYWTPEYQMCVLMDNMN